MRRTARSLALAAALLTLLVDGAGTAAARDYNNWHIHSGMPQLGELHRSAGFFPVILGVDLATYTASPGLWAYCPNATDKVLVGGDGGRTGAAGVCMNEAFVIHLLTIKPGQSAPDSWTLVPGTSFTYFLLSPAP